MNHSVCAVDDAFQIVDEAEYQTGRFCVEVVACVFNDSCARHCAECLSKFVPGFAWIAAEPHRRKGVPRIAGRRCQAGDAVRLVRAGGSMWMTLLFSNADWAPLGSTGAATAIEMIVAAAWITITIGVSARMGESSHRQNINDRDKPRSNEWL